MKPSVGKEPATSVFVLLSYRVQSREMSLSLASVKTESLHIFTSFYESSYGKSQIYYLVELAAVVF